jgi:hypothetical protein
MRDCRRVTRIMDLWNKCHNKLPLAFGYLCKKMHESMQKK